MSENYQIGDLIEATVILGGRERRELLSYQPDPGPEEDLFPWQRIERGGWDTFTSYFSAEDLADVVRLVAVPVISRDQVQAVVDYWFDKHEANSSISHDEMIVSGVMALFEQGKQ